MTDAVLVFAVICACMGAFQRSEDGRVKFNATALALLASTAVTSALFWLEVPFDLTVWLAIDVAVIVVVGVVALWRRSMPWTDWAVFALFAPSWYFYVYPDPLGPVVSTLAVSAQLLLTVPFRGTGLRRLVARWKASFQHRHEWTDIDPRRSHG